VTSGADFRAALRSLWRQGILGSERREYFRLIWKGISRDAERFRDAGRSARRMARRVQTTSHGAVAPAFDGASGDASLSAFVRRAREAVLRVDLKRSISEVDAWASGLQQKIEGRAATGEDLNSLFLWNREYYVRQRQLHRFPGAYLVKAFNLAIKGLHYHRVMNGIMRQSNMDVAGPGSGSAATSYVTPMQPASTAHAVTAAVP
jgi:hypothetical protein